MSLTLGQSIAEDISDAIPVNDLTPEQSSGKDECTKCHLLHPKEEYVVQSQKKDKPNPHNVVFLVKDRKTGRDIKVAFRNGIKNEKGVRVLKTSIKSKNPCHKFSKRCVYRLISRKTGRPYKIDFKKCLKNGKHTVKLTS
ncbi:hypothetical protein KR200_004173 [Drosophila serrata]|nr:hypothetical protein KR200_007706 [Drosophila serrata]KAH8394025.1 hypothetical protein KR200_004173 [Drosophila serrata]